MTLTQKELEYLAAWAREEWEPACYQLPAHRLQLAHGVSGASLIRLIKWWTESAQKKDQDILEFTSATTPVWPWSNSDELRMRLDEASGNRPAA